MNMSLIGLLLVLFVDLIKSNTDCLDAFSCDINSGTSYILDTNISCLGYDSCNGITLTASDTLNCFGSLSCENSEIVSSNGNVHCTGYKSCIKSSISSKSANIVCDGDYSCNGTHLIMSDGTNNLECNGDYSCNKLYWDNSGSAVSNAICNGDFSCHETDIGTIDTIECNGYQSCSDIDTFDLIVDTKVTGNGYRSLYNSWIHSSYGSDTFEVVFNGDYSGEETIVYCNKDCHIYCNSPHACSKTKIFCPTFHDCNFTCPNNCDYECPEIESEMLLQDYIDNKKNNINNEINDIDSNGDTHNEIILSDDKSGDISIISVGLLLFSILLLILCCIYSKSINNNNNNEEYSELIDHEISSVHVPIYGSSEKIHLESKTTSKYALPILLLFGGTILTLIFIKYYFHNNISNISQHSYYETIDETELCYKTYYQYAWTSCSSSTCKSKFKNNNDCECSFDTYDENWETRSKSVNWWGRRNCECTIECDVTNIYCDDENDCTDSTLDASWVYCRNADGCQNKIINVIGGAYCQGDSSCKNTEINSEYNVYCESDNSCHSSTITTVNTTGENINCFGKNSCKYASLTSNNNINCSDYGCQLSKVSSKSNINCNGKYGCYEIEIESSLNTYCNGDYSCSNSDIESTKNIYGYGDNSLEYAEIHSSKSKGDELNIYLSGKLSGNELNIYCESDVTCNIYCQTPDACTNTIMTCESGSICNTNGCNSTDTQCPYNCPIVY